MLSKVLVDVGVVTIVHRTPCRKFENIMSTVQIFKFDYVVYSIIL